MAVIAYAVPGGLTAVRSPNFVQAIIGKLVIREPRLDRRATAASCVRKGSRQPPFATIAPLLPTAGGWLARITFSFANVPYALTGGAAIVAYVATATLVGGAPDRA